MVFNKIRKNKKGFSLVELIVVIAVMAVLLAILTPSLLAYVERSRAQKDDSAMSEVTNAIKLAMADQDVYDEMLQYNELANVAGYADGVTDETSWPATGTMRGVTITFTPANKVAALADGKINDLMNPASTKPGVLSSTILYNKVRVAVGDTVELSSQTYRNSPYTVFITMGTLGGNDPSKMNAIQTYGQWGGTNLSDDGTGGGGQTTACTKSEDCAATEHDQDCPKVSSGPIELADNFEDNTWAEIAVACQQNNIPNTWNVGDTKAMTINGQEYNVMIIGKDHDTYSDGSGTAPLTFQTDIVEIRNGMSDSTGAGWDGSGMYGYLNDTTDGLFNSMECGGCIKAVNKVTNIGRVAAGNKEPTVNDVRTTQDKLFLLSVREIYSTQDVDYLDAEGSQYAYYAGAETSDTRENSNAIKYYDGEQAPLGLRTPGSYPSDNVSFFYYIYSGRVMINGAMSSIGISFGFCF